MDDWVLGICILLFYNVAINTFEFLIVNDRLKNIEREIQENGRKKDSVQSTYDRV